MRTVYAIEKLIDFNTGERQVFSTYDSEEIAKTRLSMFDGIQLVLLANGQIVPEYVIIEQVVVK